MHEKNPYAHPEDPNSRRGRPAARNDSFENRYPTTNDPRPESHADTLTDAPARTPTSNGLGIAGFIVSLVGLICTAGFLSPIALILSLIAVTRRPRGFAVAGIIISLPGIVAAILISIAYVSYGVSLPAAYDTSQTGFELANQIDAYTQAHSGALPPSLDDLPPTPQTRGLLDYWGHPYTYRILPDNATIELVSPGRDGVPRNIDDLYLQIRGKDVQVFFGTDHRAMPSP